MTERFEYVKRETYSEEEIRATKIAFTHGEHVVPVSCMHDA